MYAFQNTELCVVLLFFSNLWVSLRCATDPTAGERFGEDERGGKAACDIFQLIKNQKELEMFQEKSKVLQEELTVLSSQKAELESTQGGGNDAEGTIQLQKLKEQHRRSQASRET